MDFVMLVHAKLRFAHKGISAARQETSIYCIQVWRLERAVSCIQVWRLERAVSCIQVWRLERAGHCIQVWRLERACHYIQVERPERTGLDVLVHAKQRFAYMDISIFHFSFFTFHFSLFVFHLYFSPHQCLIRASISASCLLLPG